jgi:hypothetical protein
MTMKPRVVQSERFHGLLVPFTKSLLASTEKNFAALNEALKKRVETTTPARGNA